MTSIDFLNKVHKSLDSQEYSLSYSPAKSKNYMLYCNGNFIGGLFDEELCFVYADSVSELLGQPEPVYRGYSSTAQHRMLVTLLVGVRFSHPQPKSHPVYAGWFFLFYIVIQKQRTVFATVRPFLCSYYRMLMRPAP